MTQIFASWDREAKEDARVLAASGLIAWQPEPKRRRTDNGPKGLGFWSDTWGTGSGPSTGGACSSTGSADPSVIYSKGKGKGRKGKLQLKNAAEPLVKETDGKGTSKDTGGVQGSHGGKSERKTQKGRT